MCDVRNSVSTITTRLRNISWRPVYHGLALKYRPKLSLLWSPSLRRNYRNIKQQTSWRLRFREIPHKPCQKPIKLTCLPSMTSNQKHSLRYREFNELALHRNTTNNHLKIITEGLLDYFPPLMHFPRRNAQWGTKCVNLVTCPSRALWHN